MANKITLFIFLNLFILLSCDANIVDGKFQCDPDAIDPCPEGFACIQKGTDDQHYCFQSANNNCGDGIMDENEECDGDDFGDFECSEGFKICRSNCKRGCSVCGNEILEQIRDATGNTLGGEECDDGNSDNSDGCTSNCKLGRAYCTPQDLIDYTDSCSGSCGDSIKNGPEMCDSSDFGSLSCFSLGFAENIGELGCATDCSQFDTSQCAKFYCDATDYSNNVNCLNYCGDGKKNDNEICDANDNGGLICESFGYYGGELLCNSDCKSYNKSNCSGFCGDGILNGQEICDGTNYRYESSCNLLGSVHCTGFCITSYQQCVNDSWTKLDDVKGLSVWGTSNNNVYAVGSTGIITHYDGNSWNPMSSNVSVNLNGIWGSGVNDIFAVGDSGTILHYDGNSWNTMNSGTTLYLAGVWGTASNNVYAVGSSGTILHYDGSSWSAMSSNVTKTLKGIHGRNENDIYAVGLTGTIVHYDGNNWSVMTSGTIQHLNNVWLGSDPNKVYAVGHSGTILFYNGSSWTSVISGSSEILNGIWGSGPSNLYVVGLSTEILHYNGNFWTQIKNDKIDSFGNADFLGVWGYENNIYMISFSKLINYNETELFSSYETIIAINSIWGNNENDIYAVGQTGTLLHYDGDSWSSETSPAANSLVDVWGSSASDVYAVGNFSEFVYFNGISWSNVTSPVSNIGLKGIWGSSASDIYVVGQTGTILHYDGGSWTSIASPTTAFLFSIWGSSASDIYAVGNNGTIIHYDGGSWTSITSPAIVSLFSIWGSSASDIYAVGQLGTIIHYDGTSWNEIDSITDENLNDVWGSGPNDIYAVGQNGIIIHYDGALWSFIKSDSDIHNYTVWGSSEKVFLGTTTDANGKNIKYLDPNVIPKLDGGFCKDPVYLYCNNSLIYGDNLFGKESLDSSGTPIFNYYSSCGSIIENNGFEDFYVLDNPVNGDITVKVTPYKGNVNLVVLSEDGEGYCDITNSGCVNISTNDGTQIEEITFSGAQGAKYYIIVDSNSGDESPYKIQVNCNKN
jgi:cysteine-rich repeat protein